MRHSFLLPAAALTGALLLGCADQQSPTAPLSGSSPLPAGPAFARGDLGAGVGGGGIGRGGALGFGIWFSDLDRGLTTLLGIPASRILDLCSGTADPEFWPALFVGRPQDGLKVLLNNRETSVTVWQLVSDDLCGVLGTTEPYAVGTAHARLTDNEASDFPIAPGGNSAAIRANGTVTVLATGEELHYQAVSHLLRPPGATSPDDVRFLQNKILLH
jgi:hypothetical protein